MIRSGETYLGDGLYARCEHGDFWLRAPRGHEDHEVALEPEVMLEFLRFAWNTEPQMMNQILSRVTGAGEHGDR